MADTGCPPLIVEGDWSPAQNKTMKNKLQLYFQSKKKSGGGDCRVEAEDGAPRAEVYFISEEGESLDQDQDQGVRCWTQYRKLGCCRVKFSGENFISTVFGGRRRSNDDLVPEREEFEPTVFQLCADNKQNDFRKRISPWINKVFLILMTSKSMISVILLCVHTHCKITRRLFHATRANFIHLINKQGFNQSYAGHGNGNGNQTIVLQPGSTFFGLTGVCSFSLYCSWNTGWLLLFFSFSLAAMYGSGSYFAVDLVYSAQGYAKPNAMRHKRMYLARVLVGDFTQGRAGLITPPAKSSRNSADLVDTDQNPMSLQCPLQQCEEGFISCDTHTKQKIQERLRSSSEISHSYSQVMNQPDSVSRYQIPQRAVDHSTQYDHQQILIMQDDPTVRKAATSLYEKRPAVTSVYVLDKNQRPKLIQGASVPLSEDSRLTLVGHGERDSSGETRLAGYTAQDVAKIIQRTFRTGDKIKTTSVVACEVGSDKEFVETLLRELRETANIETELHLRSAVLQVRHTGEIITQEISKEGLRWRHNDDSKKVVATLDRNGDVIIRTEPGRRGEVVFTNERNFLMGKKKNTQKKPGGKGEASNTQVTYRNSWPDEPQIFIDQDVYKNLNSYVKTGCIETSALSWIIFHEKLPLPEKINTEILNLNNFVIGERIKKKDNKIINNKDNKIIDNKDNKIIDNKDNKYVIKWIEKEQDIKHLLSKCYVIKSGRDVRSIIRHYAKDGEDKITYLMVKDWIYAVDPVNLYIHLVGKQFNHEKDQNRQTWEAVKKCIEHQVNMEQYNQIRSNINDKKHKLIYTKYVKGILHPFRFRENLKLSIETEAWCTTYFTASVIAESARNFRTFPLILMALDMTESEHQGKSLEFFFEKHSMARGGTWIDPNLRGFRGSAKLPPDASPSSKAKLKEVLYREGDLYNFWIKTKDNAVLDDEKVFKIVEKFNLTEGDSAEIEKIVTNYNDFKTKINSGPSASGP